MTQNLFSPYNFNVIFLPKISFLSINTILKFKQESKKTPEIKQREKIIELIHEISDYENKHKEIIIPDGSEKETITEFTLQPILSSITYETHQRKSNLSYSCKIFPRKEKGLEDYIVKLDFSKPIFVSEDIESLTELVVRYHIDNFNINPFLEKSFLKIYKTKIHGIEEILNNRKQIISEMISAIPR